jgi:hypothetical protein
MSKRAHVGVPESDFVDHQDDLGSPVCFSLVETPRTKCRILSVKINNKRPIKSKRIKIRTHLAHEAVQDQHLRLHKAPGVAQEMGRGPYFRR